MTEVKLEIFNMLGQNICTLVSGGLAPGMHRVEWDGRDALGDAVATGTYIYRLQIGEFVQSRRLLLLR